MVREQRYGRVGVRGVGRRRRIVAGVLIATSLVAGWPGPVHADDANHHQYSVLYGGNYSAADAHRFSRNLYYFGRTGTWVGKTQTSYDAAQSDVAHWDLTNGYPGVDPWQGANQRDLVYLSTHGWPGQMRFYKPRWVGSSASAADWRRRLDQNRAEDNIGPRKNDLCGSNTYGWERNLWEIGASYLSGSTTRTNSRWNDDIEWIFLASCGQLSTGGTSPGSRALYARTLLGSPRRAHSIMGYRDTAPGDATDVDIVDSLFRSLSAGRSIRYSWLTANSLYSGSAKNAAVVLHQRHTYEGLPPVSPREADSPAGSAVDVRYWYLNMFGNPDGGGGVQLSEGPVESLWSRGVAAVRTLLTPERAVAEEGPIVLHGRETTFRLRCELPSAPATMGPALLSPDARTSSEVARGVLGGRWSDVSELDEGITTFSDGARTLYVFAGDGYLLQEDSEYGEAEVGFDQKEAVRVADAYLARNGGVPDDAFVDQVLGVSSAALDPETGETSDDTVCAYIVEYRHEYNGVPISGNEGDVISVVVDAEKRVSQMRRTWRDLSGSGNPSKVIPARDAFETLASDGERVAGLPPEVDVSEVRLVYYACKSDVRQSAMWPAWEFTVRGDDEGAAPAKIFVDARTNKVVSD